MPFGKFAEVIGMRPVPAEASFPQPAHVPIDRLDKSAHARNVAHKRHDGGDKTQLPGLAANGIGCVIQQFQPL